MPREFYAALGKSSLRSSAQSPPVRVGNLTRHSTRRRAVFMNESRICRRRLIRWEDICSRLRFVSWLPLRQSTNVSQSIVSSRSPERLERSRNLVWQRFILGQSVGDTPFVVIMNSFFCLTKRSRHYSSHLVRPGRANGNVRVHRVGTARRVRNRRNH